MNAKVEYREQSRRVRVYGKGRDMCDGHRVRKDVEVVGYMASRGRWSAWGETRAAALAGLHQLEPETT